MYEKKVIRQNLGHRKGVGTNKKTRLQNAWFCNLVILLSLFAQRLSDYLKYSTPLSNINWF